MGSLAGLWGPGDRTPWVGLGNASSPPASHVQLQRGCAKHSCVYTTPQHPFTNKFKLNYDVWCMVMGCQFSLSSG